MGVTGCGKSNLNATFSESLNIPLLDSDDFHPAGNIYKISRRALLEDEDFWPWHEILGKALRAKSGHVMLGWLAQCRVYRNCLTAGSGEPILFVHLSVTRALIAKGGHRSDSRALSQ